MKKIVLIGLFLLGACNEDGSYKKDSIPEEILEEIIEQKFDIIIDLTPEIMEEDYVETTNTGDERL